MKLAILMDTADVSGPAKQLLALLPRLVVEGVAPHVIVFQPHGRAPTAYGEAVRSLGVEHTVVSSLGGIGGGLVRRLQSVLETVGPDIVQTHSYRPTALVSLVRLRSRPKWRWVAFFHGATRENARVRLYHIVDNVLMRFSDRIVVVARAQERRFRGPAPALRRIHNAVLVGESEMGAAFSVEGVDSPTPRIAVIGRLSHEKGVDLFLHALAKLSMRGVSFFAAIVGDGVERVALERLRDDLGLTGRVRFYGRVAPVAPVYEWSNLVVIPSRSEGMPNVLLEALQARRRVVATNVGNISELVEGSRLAAVVPAGDVAALADAIEAEVRRPETEADAEACATFLARYSLENRLEDHLALYRDVLR